MAKMRSVLFTVILFYFCQNVSAQDTLLLINGKRIIVSSVDLHDYTIAYRPQDNSKKLKTIDPNRLFSILYRDGKERIVYQPDSLDPLDFKVEEMRTFIHGEEDARILYKNTTVKAFGVAVGAGSAFLTFYGIIGPPIYATVLGSFSPNVEKKLTFQIGGNAADELGISAGSYLNNVTGKNASPIIKKEQKLKIANKTIRFKQDTNLDSTVALINSRFNCLRVHAANEEGKLKLYKTNAPERIKESPYQEGFEKRVRDYKIRNGMIYGLVGFVAMSIALSIKY
jgi:hypothetical protein